MEVKSRASAVIFRWRCWQCYVTRFVLKCIWYCTRLLRPLLTLNICGVAWACLQHVFTAEHLPWDLISSLLVFKLNWCRQRSMSDTWQYAIWPESRSRSSKINIKNIRQEIGNYYPDPDPGQGGPKVAKMANFRIWDLRWYAYNQKTDDELWCSNTISKFWLDRLLIFVVVRRHMTFKLSVFHL